MKSNYFDKMYFLRKKVRKIENENLFISIEAPIDIEHNILFKSLSDKKELEEFVEFINKNYKNPKDNSLLNLSLEKILSYMNIDAQAVVLKEKEIMSGMITFVLPISVSTNLKISLTNDDKYKYMKKDDKVIIFAYSTCLASHLKYRRKGYGITLLQKNLLEKYNEGVITAYATNNISRVDNSIIFYNWCVYFKSKFNKDIKPYKSAQSNTTILIVNENNSEEALNFYLQKLSDKQFYMSPSLLFWTKWIKIFPTYLVLDNNKTVGIFSLSNHSINYISNGISQSCDLLFCIGEQSKTLISAINYAEKTYDYIIFKELGDINIKVISSIPNAYRISKLYINFYNLTLYIKPENFYAPIL